MLGAVKWVLGFGLVWVVSIPVNGILTSTTWGWFVVPATGAREISISQGVGLSMFLFIAGTVVTSHVARFEVAENEDTKSVATRALGKAIGVGLLAPAATLAVTWVWQAFFLAPI